MTFIHKGVLQVISVKGGALHLPGLPELLQWGCYQERPSQSKRGFHITFVSTTAIRNSVQHSQLPLHMLWRSCQAVSPEGSQGPSPGPACRQLGLDSQQRAAFRDNKWVTPTPAFPPLLCSPSLCVSRAQTVHTFSFPQREQLANQ